jgi:hypothetical protein
LKQILFEIKDPELIKGTKTLKDIGEAENPYQTKGDAAQKLKVSQSMTMWVSQQEEEGHNLDRLKKYKYLSSAEGKQSPALLNFYQRQLWDKETLTKKVGKISKMGIAGMLLNEGYFNNTGSGGYGRYK